LQSDIALVLRFDGVEERDLEALLDRQQDANSSHDSLLHTMCSADVGSAAKILDRLRSGAYDEALGLKSSSALKDSADMEVYPWLGKS
jgi:hypothetical protein